MTITSLGLATKPIAIGFLDEEPSGVPEWTGPSQPAGCAFWRFAQEGRAFYTRPEHHYNCAVGAHTHAIPLPTTRAAELSDTIGFMVAKQYIASEEVSAIPVLPTSPAFVAYAPVESCPFPADLVLIAANPGQMMLVYEASLKAGVGDFVASAIGRPACAALPLTIGGLKPTISFGCRGNRTFTGLADELLYLVLPAKAWSALEESAKQILETDRVMGEYYADKKAAFAGEGVVE